MQTVKHKHKNTAITKNFANTKTAAKIWQTHSTKGRCTRLLPPSCVGPEAQDIKDEKHSFLFTLQHSYVSRCLY